VAAIPLPMRIRRLRAPVVVGRRFGRRGLSRFRSKAAYARWNGVAPQPVLTGNKARYRLARTGNRQVNSALHRIAVRQAREPTLGRLYFELPDEPALSITAKALTRRSGVSRPSP
jgi:hypothetical protein